MTTIMKKTYTPPNLIVVPCGAPNILANSQYTEPQGNANFLIGGENITVTDGNNNCDGTIRIGGSTNTQCSKFKNGYWVDDEDEDW